MGRSQSRLRRNKHELLRSKKWKAQRKNLSRKSTLTITKFLLIPELMRLISCTMKKAMATDMGSGQELRKKGGKKKNERVKRKGKKRSSY
ncbi:unnamed protein product [Trifolium pratense]|uniref:Uncharacterized protein n=1 Tax=Trifolium pratense TaxID=57577 RepID=A0ACB0J1F9_TRIPR|nr:unnamed protein product [Trifolium pratense]